MKEQCWGIFVMGKERDKIQEYVEKKGYEVFEVRELSLFEKWTYCKDPVLYANDPWIIMFRATRLQYRMLIKKLKLTAVM